MKRLNWLRQRERRSSNIRFENYGLQRNWAIREVAHRYRWQLHLDADERLTDALVAEIKALPEDDGTAGYTIPRYLTFMGRLLRHNLAPTHHMRLFRDGTTECETRHYDQHFVCTGISKSLQHEMIDDIRMSLSEWTRRHNNWSDAEVRELLGGKNRGPAQRSRLRQRHRAKALPAPPI